MTRFGKRLRSLSVSDNEGKGRVVRTLRGSMRPGILERRDGKASGSSPPLRPSADVVAPDLPVP